MERRVAAILHGDVAGYSRLTEADEDGTIRALKKSFDLLAEAIAAHGGRIVNTAGDSVLAEFPSVLSAVCCAVASQRKLADCYKDIPSASKLEFRIGVHLGDVIVDGDSIFGGAVNVAARLQEMADAGGVCISRTVFDQVRRKIDVGFECLGERILKNITEPVVIYRLLLDHAKAGRIVGRKRDRQQQTGGKPWRSVAGGALCVVLVATAVLALRPWHLQLEPGATDPSLGLPFHNLDREALPRADPKRFSVAVAHLEDDGAGQGHEQLILRTCPKTS